MTFSSAFHFIKCGPGEDVRSVAECTNAVYAMCASEQNSRKDRPPIRQGLS